MSQENIEVVRRIYDQGLLDGGNDGLLALAAPDIEYVNPPEAIDPGVRRGIAEVKVALRNISEPFDAAWNELHELFDAGDRVIASVSFHTRSRGSDVDVVQHEAHTWTIRGGRIVRLEWGRDLQAALEAAGVTNE